MTQDRLGASSEPAPGHPATTGDAFLGGRINLLQPSRGYRAGIDAVLLAASVSLPPGQRADVADFGAGVGTVGLCLAARCPDAHVTLVEREPALVGLAEQNIVRNGFSSRVRVVEGDVTAPASSPAAPPLPPEIFDWVLANPPFHETAGGTPAQDPLKSASHAMDAPSLALWARMAARMAKPGGRLVLIHKTAALPALLESLGNRFGGLRIRPIYPRAGEPAIRVLVEGIKGSRAEMSLRPPVILHAPDGSFTPYVSRILREGAGLEDGAGSGPSGA